MHSIYGHYSGLPPRSAIPVPVTFSPIVYWSSSSGIQLHDCPSSNALNVFPLLPPVWPRSQRYFYKDKGLLAGSHPLLNMSTVSHSIQRSLCVVCQGPLVFCLFSTRYNQERFVLSRPDPITITRLFLYRFTTERCLFRPGWDWSINWALKWFACTSSQRAINDMQEQWDTG